MPPKNIIAIGNIKTATTMAQTIIQNIQTPYVFTIDSWKELKRPIILNSTGGKT